MPAVPTLAAVSESLDSLAIGWAVLNDPAEVTAGLDSDLDVVVDAPAVEVIRLLRRPLEAHGVSCILAVNYDIGGWASWYSSADRSHYGHFDFLHDPDGAGRLSVPTDPLVASAASLGSIPFVSDEWRLTYRVTKSLGKQQWARLAALRNLAAAADELAVVFGESSWSIFDSLVRSPSPDGWAEAYGDLRRARIRERKRRLRGRKAIERAGRQLLRMSSRVLQSVGFWVHVHGAGAEGFAAATQDWAASTLPSSDVGPALHALSGGALQLHLIRPHLAVTWSSRPVRFLGFQPDLQMDAGTASIGQLVAGMAEATRLRIQ